MKTMRKLLVSLMALVMVLGTCLTVNAAGAANPIAPIKNKTISAKAATIYTNGDNAGVEKIAVSYKWTNKNGDQVMSAPVGLKAASSNRGVVEVVGFEKAADADKVKGKTTTTTESLVLKANANGKAKITISDAANPKNKKVIQVTVKTYAEDIAFTNGLIEDGTLTIAKTKGTVVNLGAYVTNSDASNKKITYKTVTKKTNVSVDSKGNVKVTKNNPKETVIEVKSDKVVKTLTVKPEGEAVVTALTLVQDSKSQKAVLGALNKKNVLTMKGNKKSEAYTYQLDWKEDVDASALTFTSNKPNVASVDANGKITATGNGKAKITVTAKMGNKLKKAVNVTVNVSTDVEYVKATFAYEQILANGKDAAYISASTNPNASNKAVKYEISSVKDTADKDVAAADVKKYVSVSKTGVVKAKKACTAIIRAYAPDANKEVTVTVYAINPVDTITVQTAEGAQIDSKKKLTVYRDGDCVVDIPLKVTVEGKGGMPADNTNLWFNTSDWRVAYVEEETTPEGEAVYSLRAMNTGSVKITASAHDGSGKSYTFTVNVKTDAYDINTNADDDGFVYVKAGKVKLAKEIAAKTNGDASNKKLAYYVDGVKATEVSMNAGDEKAVVIKADDKRTHGVAGATANQAEETVTLKCVADDEFATTYGIELCEKANLVVGEALSLDAFVYTTEADKRVPAAAKPTFKSSNTKIATVNADGIVTAKKEGSVVITATYGEVKATSTIYVVRNYAAVEKEIETLIKTKINEENRDYTGVSVGFDGVNNYMSFEILEPNKDITELKNTGMVAMLKDILKNPADTLTYNAVGIVDYQMGNSWVIIVDGTLVSVVLNNAVVLDSVDDETAVDYVINELLAGASKWNDWDGRGFEVYMQVTDTHRFGEETVAFDFNYIYFVETYMDYATYETLAEGLIAEQLNGLAVAGAKSVSYDASNNMVDVVINDGDMTVTDAYAASKDAVVAALEVAFAEADELTLSVEVAGKKEVATKRRADYDYDVDMMEAALDEYVARLTEAGFETLEDLDGAVITSTVYYTSGWNGYYVDYAVNVTLDESVYDKAADARIADAMQANEFTFGTMDYAADANTLNVTIAADSANMTPLELTGSGLKSVLDALVSNDSVQNVVVITGKGATTIETKDAYDIGMALSEGILTLAELDDTTATIKVTYTSANGASKKTLAYTIAYDVEEPVVEETPEEVPSVSGNDTPEVTPEETPEETPEVTPDEEDKTVSDNNPTTEG